MRYALFTLILLLLAGTAAAQESFSVEKVAEGVYAAIARPGGNATSNAFFVEGRDYVVAGGAHLTKETVADLVAAVAATTAKPVRYFVLPHHHPGYSHIDFDFPPGKDVLMSWQTWQGLDGEVREIAYPVLFFSEGLTLKTGDHTIILTNIGRGHTDGDTLVYLPETGVLFTSDLLYVDSVGYMGDGHMQDWVLALEFMEGMAVEKIIPGYGPVSTKAKLEAFEAFFRDFLTAVLKHIEEGDTLEETLRTFSLPQYRDYDGYDRFLKTNVERAYRDLKETLAP